MAGPLKKLLAAKVSNLTVYSTTEHAPCRITNRIPPTQPAWLGRSKIRLNLFWGRTRMHARAVVCPNQSSSPQYCTHWERTNLHCSMKPQHWLRSLSDGLGCHLGGSKRPRGPNRLAPVHWSPTFLNYHCCWDWTFLQCIEGAGSQLRFEAKIKLCYNHAGLHHAPLK